MKKVSFILFFMCFAFVKAQTLQWSSYTDSIVVISSPRVADLNSDGVLDIVIGGGTDSYQSNYGIMAFDGLNGNNLWTVSSSDEIFGSAIFNDISGDGIPDVFIGGRHAQFYAINGANGNILWEAFPQTPGINPSDSGMYNYYSGQIIPDQNNDQIEDILIANGGDHYAAPWDPRPPGHLMVLDGLSGSVLAKAVMPDSNETYCSPIVTDLKNNGVLHVIYGSGGEHHGGSVWVAELVNDLMNNDLSGSIQLATTPNRGFIAPASIADFSSDNVLDIVIQGFDGTIYLFDGNNFQQKWSVNIPNSESSSAPVIGNFTGGSLIPDIFAVTYNGAAPSYFDYYQVMIDGATGSIEWMDSIGDMHFASANAFDSNGDGRDEVLVSLNNNNGYFEHELMMIDFQNDQVFSYYPSYGGVNLASTPYIGDIDSDNNLDIIYTYRADSVNIGAWNGMYTERIATQITMPFTGLAWGSYMGTNYDGHYNYTSVNCGAGSLVSSLSITNPSCNLFSDGNVAVVVQNSAADYTYLWSDGSVNDSLINATAGTYSVIVTDTSGCYEVRSLTLNDPYTILFGNIQNNPCQGDSLGSATLSSSGCPCMFSTCSYDWENGDSTKLATGLSAGYWSVIITHMDGCVVVDSVEILDGGPVIDSSLVVQQHCYNLNDASIQLFPNDTAFTEYNWNTGEHIDMISNLQPGNYSVSVNTLNCYDSLFFTINPADSIFISEIHSDVLCHGYSDGTITVSATGGAQGFTYVLNGASYNVNNFNAPAGSYSIYVIDSLGCLSDTLGVTINEPTQLTGLVYSSPETDNGWNDGTASITASGGVSPYSFLWNDSLGQTSSTAIALSTGDYIVVVTDSNGCSYSDTVNVGTTTSIDDLVNHVYIHVYPNPVIENFIIETNFSKEYQLSIYNSSGKLIRELNNLKGNIRIERGMLPLGLYILSIDIGKKVFNYPIIIE